MPITTAPLAVKLPELTNRLQDEFALEPTPIEIVVAVIVAPLTTKPLVDEAAIGDAAEGAVVPKLAVRAILTAPSEMVPPVMIK